MNHEEEKEASHVLREYLTKYTNDGEAAHDKSSSQLLRNAVLLHGGFDDADDEKMNVRRAIEASVAAHKQSSGDAMFNSIDEEGRTLLHLACTNTNRFLENAPDASIVRCLLNACSSPEVVNARDVEGRTPLATLIGTIGSKDWDGVDGNGLGLICATEMLLPLTHDKASCKTVCAEHLLFFEHGGPKTLLDIAFHLDHPHLVTLLLCGGAHHYTDGLDEALNRQGTCEIVDIVETLLHAVVAGEAAGEAGTSIPDDIRKKLRFDMCRTVLRNYMQEGFTSANMDFTIGSMASDLLLPGIVLDDYVALKYLTTNMNLPARRENLVRAITKVCHDS